jgi:hypothetical protein
MLRLLSGTVLVFVDLERDKSVVPVAVDAAAHDHGWMLPFAGCC